MRTGNLAGARADIIDRSAAQKAFEFSGAGIGPHAATVRMSYSVNAAKRAYIYALKNTYFRSAIATVVGESGLTYFNSTLQPATIPIAALNTFDNTLNNVQAQNLSYQFYQSAGESLLLQTFDQSTGGAATYRSSIQLTEFDV